MRFAAPLRADAKAPLLFLRPLHRDFRWPSQLGQLLRRRTFRPRTFLELSPHGLFRLRSASHLQPQPSLPRGPRQHLVLRSQPGQPLLFGLVWESEPILNLGLAPRCRVERMLASQIRLWPLLSLPGPPHCAPFLESPLLSARSAIAAPRAVHKANDPEARPLRFPTPPKEMAATNVDR